MEIRDIIPHLLQSLYSLDREKSESARLLLEKAGGSLAAKALDADKNNSQKKSSDGPSSLEQIRNSLRTHDPDIVKDRETPTKRKLSEDEDMPPNIHFLSDVPSPGFGQISKNASYLRRYMLDEKMSWGVKQNPSLRMSHSAHLFSSLKSPSTVDLSGPRRNKMRQPENIEPLPSSIVRFMFENGYITKEELEEFLTAPNLKQLYAYREPRTFDIIRWRYNGLSLKEIALRTQTTDKPLKHANSVKHVLDLWYKAMGKYYLFHVKFERAKVATSYLPENDETRKIFQLVSGFNSERQQVPRGVLARKRDKFGIRSSTCYIYQRVAIATAITVALVNHKFDKAIVELGRLQQIIDKAHHDKLPKYKSAIQEIENSIQILEELIKNKKDIMDIDIEKIKTTMRVETRKTKVAPPLSRRQKQNLDRSISKI